MHIYFQFADASTVTGHHDLNKTRKHLRKDKHFVQRIKYKLLIHFKKRKKSTTTYKKVIVFISVLNMA